MIFHMILGEINVYNCWLLALYHVIHANAILKKLKIFNGMDKAQEPTEHIHYDNYSHDVGSQSSIS